MLIIEFYNREKEIKEIRNLLNAEPTLITFIYGPINSGKTELINQVIKKLPENYRVFYINLRGRFIRDYSEFIKVLFDIEYKERLEKIKEILKPIAKVLPESYYGIPIPKDLFLKVFEKKEVEDAFIYIETVFRTLQKNGFIPILIIDELQVIGDIKIDELLIYKLFNFFVRLTKELHLAHVFAITSDSLFIERIYSEAMLQGRCEYLLVDDFGKEITTEFLEKYHFSEDEKKIAWYYCGGKPIILRKLINLKLSNENVEEKAKEMLMIRKGQIEELIYSLEEMDRERFEKVVKILKQFEEKEIVRYKYLNEEIRFLVGKNIIFANPGSKVLKPQSKLDLLAIREVL